MDLRRQVSRRISKKKSKGCKNVLTESNFTKNLSLLFFPAADNRVIAAGSDLMHDAVEHAEYRKAAKGYRSVQKHISLKLHQLCQIH